MRRSAFLTSNDDLRALGDERVPDEEGAGRDGALPDAVVVGQLGVQDAQRAVAALEVARPLVLAGEDADGRAVLLPAALPPHVVDHAAQEDVAARVHLLVGRLRGPRLLPRRAAVARGGLQYEEQGEHCCREESHLER